MLPSVFRFSLGLCCGHPMMLGSEYFMPCGYCVGMRLQLILRCCVQLLSPWGPKGLFCVEPFESWWHSSTVTQDSHVVVLVNFNFFYHIRVEQRSMYHSEHVEVTGQFWGICSLCWLWLPQVAKNSLYALNHLTGFCGFLFCVFPDRVFLWSPSCLETHFVDQVSIKRRDLSFIPKCWD